MVPGKTRGGKELQKFSSVSVEVSAVLFAKDSAGHLHHLPLPRDGEVICTVVGRGNTLHLSQTVVAGGTLAATSSSSTILSLLTAPVTLLGAYGAAHHLVLTILMTRFLVRLQTAMRAFVSGSPPSFRFVKQTYLR